MSVYFYSSCRPDWRGGRRLVGLVKKGRKEIRLLDLGTFETYKIPAAEERQLQPAKTRGTKKLIQDKVRLYKKLGMAYPRAAVKAVLQNLKAGVA